MGTAHNNSWKFAQHENQAVRLRMVPVALLMAPLSLHLSLRPMLLYDYASLFVVDACLPACSAFIKEYTAAACSQSVSSVYTHCIARWQPNAFFARKAGTVYER